MRDLITIGKDKISTLFTKDMGIKSVAVGNDEIFRRPGGYLYIQLTTSTEPTEEERNDD